MLSSILTGCVNNLEIITNSEILTAKNLGMISITQPVHIILKNNSEEFTLGFSIFSSFKNDEGLAF